MKQQENSKQQKKIIHVFLAIFSLTSKSNLHNRKLVNHAYHLVSLHQQLYLTK